MMKLTMLAAMAVLATAAHAEQTARNFYDSHGAFAGTARTIWQSHDFHRQARSLCR
jgi:hypothetical protein